MLEILAANDVVVGTDNAWQQRARLMQSLWRHRQGRPAGPRSSTDPSPLGSRLLLEDGVPPLLWNYLSQAAKEEVIAAERDSPTTGALLSKPRLWVDLLSSQPLCFNLFAPLKADLALASAVFARLLPDRVEQVTNLLFEYSPGRRSLTYTGNRSAFDVYVEFTGPRGDGFFGIEVKYHENLKAKAASDPDHRYPAMARSLGVFREDSMRELVASPLQQLWLDHLLVLRMREVHPDKWQDGAFALLYPAENRPCADAAAAYTCCLTSGDTFVAMTMERLLEVGLGEARGDRWAVDVYDRYLNPEPLVALGLPGTTPWP
jgi:hypothetical protein